MIFISAGLNTNLKTRYIENKENLNEFQGMQLDYLYAFYKCISKNRSAFGWMQMECHWITYMHLRNASLETEVHSNECSWKINLIIGTGS